MTSEVSSVDDLTCETCRYSCYIVETARGITVRQLEICVQPVITSACADADQIRMDDLACDAYEEAPCSTS